MTGYFLYVPVWMWLACLWWCTLHTCMWTSHSHYRSSAGGFPVKRIRKGSWHVTCCQSCHEQIPPCSGLALTLRLLLCRLQSEVSSSLPFLSLLSCWRYFLQPSDKLITFSSQVWHSSLWKHSLQKVATYVCHSSNARCGANLIQPHLCHFWCANWLTKI